MSELIDAAGLKQQMATGDSPVVLHVLTEEAFASAHLPGSRNACVYEVTFPDTVAKLVPDKSQPVVVYGESAEFHAADRADERLAELGYTQVRVFRGGLQEWRAAGFPIEGNGPTPQPLPQDGTFAIDLQQSFVAWEGSNLLNRHYGTVGLRSGSVTVQGGQVTAAECIADLQTIACEDIQIPEMNAMLVAYLKSDDFFDVAHHPEARFSLTAVEPIVTATPGEKNATITGTLAIRGITQPVNFNAIVGQSGPDFVLQAVVEIDRTRWNVRYGSGKFFEALGKHLVNDLILLRLKIVASAS